MKQSSRIRIFGALCALANPIFIMGVQSTPYLSIRSQGVNAVRDMVGWQELINLGDENFYGAAAVTVEYDQTFRAGRIANALFNGDSNFDNDKAVFVVSGSRAETRGTIDWLGDYFGLPVNFISNLTLRPKIQNVIVDPCLYFGFGNAVPGLYATLDFPIVHSRWGLNFSEQVLQAGTQGYSVGYFSDAAQAADTLLQTASSYFTGGSHNITRADGSNLPFDTLNYARWSACTRHITRLADLAAELGYNFIENDGCYAGLKFRVTAPTGNRPEGIYAFEPIVGNGKHWEVGGGFIGHVMLCRNPETDATWSMYVNANMTHLCQARQKRVFDLCAPGANSRYMLAERLIPVNNGLEGSEENAAAFATDSVLTPSNFQFGDRYTPVANLTRRDVRVEAAIQADVAIKFCYNNGNGCSVDVGYDFWGRTAEKVCLDTSCPSPIAPNTWALKGDSMVYGFIPSTPLSVALAPSQSEASIHNGTNRFAPGDDAVAANQSALVNNNIDNGQFAYQLGTPLVATPDTVLDASVNQTKTSIQPIFLSDSADILDMRTTVGLSHKIFVNFNYTGKDHDNWKPFIGAGASGEFGRNSYFYETPACLDAQSPFPYNKASISQWGVWVKGGLAFNFAGDCN